MSFLKKRAVCAVLAAAMALSFTACGGSEGGEEAEAEYTYAEQGGSISLPEGLAAPEENGSTNTLLEAGQLSGCFTAVNYTATSYFTHSGSVTVTVSGESSQEGTQWTDAFISLWKQGENSTQYIESVHFTLDGSPYTCTFNGLDTAAQYRVTFTYNDVPRYKMTGEYAITGVVAEQAEEDASGEEA